MATRQKSRPPPRRSGEFLAREPTTPAAVALVQAILEATADLLEEHGWDRLTTNHVAERAGVSVGSVYYYFPTKNAIVVEMARRLEQRTAERVAAALTRLSPEPAPREVATELIDVLLDPDLGAHRVRRILQTHVPSVHIAPISERLDGTVIDYLANLLAQPLPEWRPGCAPLRAFVVFHACEAVVEAAVRKQPELLGDGAFRQELVDLALRYATFARD